MFLKIEPLKMRINIWNRFLNIHCQNYKLDYTKEPLYQFFDSPKFTTGMGYNASQVTPSSNEEHDAYLATYNLVNVTTPIQNISTSKEYDFSYKSSSCQLKNCQISS